MTRIPSHTIEDAPAAARPLEPVLASAGFYLGLTVFTSYFLNYAATELDLPAGPNGPPGAPRPAGG